MNNTESLTKTALSVLLLAASSIFWVSCKDKKVDAAIEAATAEFDLQLEIEREMLEVEREMLALERAQLEEARDAALAEADSANEAARAAEAEAERARQELARANSPQVTPAPSPQRIPDRQPVRTGGGAPGYATHYQGGQQHSANSDYRLFYEELRPHGSWFETGSYGYVWQPEIARRSRDWRPYTQGRWMDSDQGWAWWSDEPFGWATYHYGRWTLFDNVGWIWVPGPDWAPAWVSWRESRDHIGWAPLPPVTLYETKFNYGQRTDVVCGIPPHHYNFVPVNYFVEPQHHHYIPPVQNVQIIQQTTNVTYIHIHNETVIVNGPQPEPLRERFGRERMPYHTLSRNEWEPERRSNLAPRQQGGIIEFVAPIIAALGSNQARPSRLEGRLDQLVPAHPAAKADTEIVQRFVRERARQEVKTAPVEAVAPSAASPVASDTQTEQAKGVEEMRQNIREREARIQELTRQREVAVAEAKTAPVVDPEPTKAPEPEPAPVPEPTKAPEPEPAPLPEPTKAPEPEPAPETATLPPGSRVEPNGEGTDSRTGIGKSTPELMRGSRAAGLESRLEDLRRRQEELRSRPAPGSKSGNFPAAPAPMTAEPGAAPAAVAPVSPPQADNPIPAPKPEDPQGKAGETEPTPVSPVMPPPAGGEAPREGALPEPPKPAPQIEKVPDTNSEESKGTDKSVGRMQNPREQSAAAATQARMRAEQEARAENQRRLEEQGRAAELRARMQAGQEAAKVEAERKLQEQERAAGELRARTQAEERARAAASGAAPMPQPAEDQDRSKGRGSQDRTPPPGRDSVDERFRRGQDPNSGRGGRDVSPPSATKESETPKEPEATKEPEPTKEPETPVDPEATKDPEMPKEPEATKEPGADGGE